LALAELDLRAQAAAYQVIKFVSVFGDLSGELDCYRETTTAGWAPFVLGFHAAAMAWDPPDERGVRYRGNDARVPVAARSIGLVMSILSEAEFELAAGVVRCRTLRAYAAHQAMAMLMDATPVQRCQRCREWFPPRRSTGRFCTTTCQDATAEEHRVSRALARADHGPATNGHHLGDLGP
jgi:hypothetical protein